MQTLLKFWNNCAISIQQKCELHKPGKTNKIFWRNRFEFSKSCFHYNFYSIIQLFSNFLMIKKFFFWLEICGRLGNYMMRLLSNEIKIKINANSWIKNERKSSKELFLLILMSSFSISLYRYISSISHLLSRSSIWKIRHSDWTSP